jgi:hypothetical protein
MLWHKTAAMLWHKTAARFGSAQVPFMQDLVGRESELNPYAINTSSGACGIPQAYPCSKLLAVIGSLDNVEGQLDWMVDYIANRYGTPAKTIDHHNAKGWY